MKARRKRLSFHLLLKSVINSFPKAILKFCTTKPSFKSFRPRYNQQQSRLELTKQSGQYLRQAPNYSTLISLFVRRVVPKFISSQIEKFDGRHKAQMEHRFLKAIFIKNKKPALCHQKEFIYELQLVHQRFDFDRWRNATF